MFESVLTRKKREAAAVAQLTPMGWTHMGGFIFAKDGTSYDLSAADLTQLDRIEREHLFVVSH